jgi:hypothetical protein
VAGLVVDLVINVVKSNGSLLVPAAATATASAAASAAAFITATTGASAIIATSAGVSAVVRSATVVAIVVAVISAATAIAAAVLCTLAQLDLLRVIAYHFFRYSVTIGVSLANPRVDPQLSAGCLQADALLAFHH